MHESEWVPQWALLEKFVKLSFWGLNIGLALMVITNLFSEGILQVWVVLEKATGKRVVLNLSERTVFECLNGLACRRT